MSPNGGKTEQEIIGEKSSESPVEVSAGFRAPLRRHATFASDERGVKELPNRSFSLHRYKVNEQK